MLKKKEFTYKKGTKKAIIEYSKDRNDFNVENCYYFDIKVDQETTLHMFIQLDENDDAVDAGFVREILKAICRAETAKELYVRVTWNA